MDHVTPVAYLALILWLPLSLFVFSRRGAREGAIFTILGAGFVLPVGLGFKLPLVFLARGQIATLSALVGCLLFAPRMLSGKALGTGCEVFLLPLLLGPIPTALTNSDPLFFGEHHLPGLGVQDAIDMSTTQLIALGVPFILGRRLFSRPRDLIPLFLFWVGVALVYALPMLFEIVMSPQLHRMVYGYHPHEFVQQMRGGGYRPGVFVGHGLGLAYLMSLSVMASVVLYRLRRRMFGLPPRMVVAITWGLLLLGKSMGPILYGITGTLLVLFASPKRQMRFAAVVAVLVLAYPILRAEDLVPAETLLNMASVVSTDRAGSLRVRLVTEELLLERARQRIWFGWGYWGRNRVYDETTNFNFSPPTDGLWAIVLGTYGVIGFVGLFGLLTLPVLLAAMRLRRLPDWTDRMLTAGLALIVVITALDSIPNVSGGGPPALFLAGALSGVAEGARLRRRSDGELTSARGGLAAGSSSESPPVSGVSRGAAQRPRGMTGYSIAVNRVASVPSLHA
ncbi:MAG TPA: hypothetical protein VK714_05135 [Myxococcota bacterium]|nr:hypothetical protein [Myxococcota bacterium]